MSNLLKLLINNVMAPSLMYTVTKSPPQDLYMLFFNRFGVCNRFQTIVGKDFDPRNRGMSSVKY